MKRSLLGALLLSATLGFAACASPPKKARLSASFTGAWSAKLCDESGRSKECSDFHLYLVQDKDGVICGEHFVATPGAARLDEDEPGTVLGNVENETGAVVVKSGRNDAIYMGRVELGTTGLAWKRIGMVAAGVDDEPPILPNAIALRKNESQWAQEHLSALLNQGCAWPSWIPASPR